MGVLISESEFTPFAAPGEPTLDYADNDPWIHTQPSELEFPPSTQKLWENPPSTLPLHRSLWSRFWRAVYLWF